MNGYLSSLYAHSLAEFGTPSELPSCGGWILEREIPGSSNYDAMGCYPLFACKDWSHLHLDLEDLRGELVCLSLVTDPFGEYNESDLHRCFGERVLPFKTHFIADLHIPIEKIASHHRKKLARRALRCMRVEISEYPIEFLDEWTNLYQNLIIRHQIKGIRAFSREAFSKQLQIPDTYMLRAIHQGVIIGAQIWYMQNEVAYIHLAAYINEGYSLGASYALDWTAIEFFSGKARWLNHGGGAGLSSDGMDGLSMYKRGWSTETRMVYFCGRIFDQQAYNELVKERGDVATDYFPAYRKGEF